MKVGQMVIVSPYLTHLTDWGLAEIIEIEKDSYKKKAILDKDNLGLFFLWRK